MIRRAVQKDIWAINHLLKRNDLNLMSAVHLVDFCFVAELEGIIRGVVWAGVCESRQMALVDYFAVDQGFGYLLHRLARRLIKELNQDGVVQVLLFSKQEGHAWVPDKLSNRFGLYCPKEPFYILLGQTKEMVKNYARRNASPASPSA